MWYRVGKRTGTMHGKIEWGNSHNVGKGSRPTISINDNGTVVVVHESQWRRRLFYRVGTVNEEDRTISWSNEESIHCGNGMRPVVALNSKGEAIEMHITNTLGSFATFYRVGTLQESSGTRWSNPQRYRIGKRPQVALNDKGTVVEVHEQAPLNYATVCAVGKIQSSDPSTAYVRWGSLFILGRGSNPHVALNNANQVVEVHEMGFRNVYHSGGIVPPQVKAITDISDDNEYERHKLCDGISPAVAINDDGNIVFVCKTSNLLWHGSALLCHTGTWAED